MSSVCKWNICLGTCLPLMVSAPPSSPPSISGRNQWNKLPFHPCMELDPDFFVYEFDGDYRQTNRGGTPPGKPSLLGHTFYDNISFPRNTPSYPSCWRNIISASLARSAITTFYQVPQPRGAGEWFSLACPNGLLNLTRRRINALFKHYSSDPSNG